MLDLTGQPRNRHATFSGGPEAAGTKQSAHPALASGTLDRPSGAPEGRPDSSPGHGRQDRGVLPLKMKPADDDREKGQQHQKAWTVYTHPKALTMRMSPEGERATDARIQDEPDCAPPH